MRCNFDRATPTRSTGDNCDINFVVLALFTLRPCVWKKVVMSPRAFIFQLTIAVRETSSSRFSTADLCTGATCPKNEKKRVLTIHCYFSKYHLYTKKYVPVNEWGQRDLNFPFRAVLYLLAILSQANSHCQIGEGRVARRVAACSLFT